MKKYLAAFVLLVMFVATPTLAQASTSNQSFWKTLMGVFVQPDAEQQTAATVVSRKSITVTPAGQTGSTPVTKVEAVPNSRCGQTLTPVGTINQTIRCDGQNWVAAGNLLNDGVNASVGAISPHVRFNVEATDINGTAIIGRNSFSGGQGVAGRAFGENGVGVEGLGNFVGVSGYSTDGKGVHGESGAQENGIGVLGEVIVGNYGVGVEGVAKGSSGTGVVGKAIDGATAVRAVTMDDGTGYGFYQEGENTKNYFAGSLGVGTILSNVRLNVLARSSDNIAILGKTDVNDGAGVRGQADGEAGIGVEGITNGLNGAAVSGIAYGTDSWGVIGKGIGPRSIGVVGSNNANNGGVAVKAFQSGSGFAFYQEGTSAKNNLEGTLSVGYVNPGNLAPGVSAQMSGGLRIFPNTGAVRPACTNASNTRGTFWVNLGAPGVADSVQVCIRKADGTYGWE